jgi:hypothetical protein
MNATRLFAILLVVSAISLSGKDFTVKMAVKRGQKTVSHDLLPLACLTVVLDHAALPISEIRVFNPITKDEWFAEVGSFDASHPKVLTAMQGDHRSLIMVILHLPPGRYGLSLIEFQGRNLSREIFLFKEHDNYFFDVKADCVNFVGSLVVNANWDLISGQGEFPASFSLERTATRDRKWATDVVPGLAGLPSEESMIQNDGDEPNKPPLQTPASGTPAAGAPVAPPPGAAGR